MVECLCFSGKSTAANAMNEFVRVKEWQNIYVQKVECWSFGNHDKAALLIVIAMSYTFTHPLTHSRSMYLHNHTKIVCENYLLNSELLTHHTHLVCAHLIHVEHCEKSGSLMNLNTKFDFEMCTQWTSVCGFPLNWRGKFRHIILVGVSWFMCFVVFFSFFHAKVDFRMFMHRIHPPPCWIHTFTYCLIIDIHNLENVFVTPKFFFETFQ